MLSYFDGPFEGFVRGDPRLRATGVLGLSMVDVQQGDGLILQTPAGQVVFIDGGDNKLFARHAAARFRHRGTSAATPLEVDAIIITHGDADHFDGLNDLRRSETLTGDDARKRLFIHPRRVFHNGLVKSPETDAAGATIPDVGRFGRTVEGADGDLHIVDLFDDPRAAPAPMQGGPFARWGETLTHWEARGPIACRLTFGNVRFAFGGDLNQEAMARMLARLGPAALEAEIVKVPHHGSHDFDFRALQAMKPVVALVSSGDESVLRRSSACTRTGPSPVRNCSSSSRASRAPATPPGSTSASSA